MKKGVLFLVCAMIFTMLAPAQAAEIPQTKEPEMPVQSKINGKYVVSVKCGEEWREIGTLNFGKFQSTEAINLGNLMDESIAVKLSQVGGGSAYLDAVLLDGQPAVKANNNDEKLISKLSREDLDITPVGEDGVVLEFNRGKSDVLTVVGRIENIVIGKEPLQFPSENNYKSKDDIENFYTYTIGSNVGTVKADGILDKTANKEPFVKEYRVPGSGHPAGDTYFWVMNDNENLYVTVDVTPDNTFDGDKDYAKVYVDTSNGIKEFKISVPETTWGNTGFTYTDKVDYEHKVYEFSIPLSEIDNSEGDINLAFVIYGTVAMPEEYIKFDRDNYDIDLDQSDSVQAEIFLYDYEDQGYNITNDKFLHLISNDESIATISETGLITGLSIGTTTIEAVYYEPQYFLMTSEDENELPYGALHTVATVAVTKTEPKDPTLSFVPNVIEKYIGDEFSVKINYFDGFATTDVTDEVVISIDDPGIATSDSAIKGKFICKAAGETILRTTYSGITATANLIVEKRETTSGSSTPVRTPIGQILVDNKVIETLYEGDVIAKNNTYTFTADKSGESAKLWLDSEFYKGMAKDYPKRIINFNWDKGTYTLPLSCDEVLNEIDNSANKVNIFIEKVDDKEIISAAKDSAEKIGAEIISDLVDFSVYIEKSKGNTDIDSLDFYAERTINQLDKINENVSTAMKFVDDKTTLTFAPSVFNDDLANIKYRGNGIFTIVKNPQTFNDIANHWARLNIEKLASRNIAFGKENNNFAPNDFITRAEFSVMITRALGITEEEGANDFNDVSNEWYAEDISTAFSSGLINGRNDGKFYPNEKIQRKDMAVIIQNALKFVDIDYEISDEDSILKIFKDESIISDYAREATAICANSGIIMGRETKNFDPDANATRAEASAIIERMLRYIEFMN